MREQAQHTLENETAHAESSEECLARSTYGSAKCKMLQVTCFLYELFGVERLRLWVRACSRLICMHGNFGALMIRLDGARGAKWLKL